MLDTLMLLDDHLVWGKVGDVLRIEVYSTMPDTVSLALSSRPFVKVEGGCIDPLLRDAQSYAAVNST